MIILFLMKIGYIIFLIMVTIIKKLIFLKMHLWLALLVNIIQRMDVQMMLDWLMIIILLQMMKKKIFLMVNFVNIVAE